MKQQKLVSLDLILLSSSRYQQDHLPAKIYYRLMNQFNIAKKQFNLVKKDCPLNYELGNFLTLEALHQLADDDEILTQMYKESQS